MDAQVLRLQQQNVALRSDVADRQREIAAANSKAWLIEEARKLGYVLPGEQVFILTTPGASLPPDGGVDYKQLPIYSPTPKPTPSPSPGVSPPPAQPTSVPGRPTPYVFILPTPPPAH